LVERWQQRYGRAVAEAICRTNNRPPPLTLRVNTRRIGRPQLLASLQEAGCRAEPGRVAPAAIVVHGRTGPVTELPGYGEGLFLVQDEAAQLACLLAGELRQGSRCLDGCAGLGGKTASLLLAAEDGVLITAVEPEKRRFRLLADNMARLGLSGRVRPFAGSLAGFAATSPGLFDLIFIDAPCSGTGVIRRHPDIRWNRRPGDPDRYHEQQLGLLTTAAGLLAAGGILVYATCSLEPEENRQVIEEFLAGSPDFSVDPCAALLPEAAAGLVDDHGFLHPLPADTMDGFFAARLIRDPGL
ncbi:MAG TPA: RsmB/NOP family class I SAM-dependent RNA methyltransferase, partial [Desulfobulbus sp.]|nr:RsmB/NOP family class I SAM-dependent RNA methyltransferase [Desulfobulbus sp.]